MIRDFSKAVRHLPYFQHREATNLKPVLCGIHLTQNSKLQFTFKFADACYLMAISWRKQGVLPLNKKGYITLRCKTFKCRAKTQIKYKIDLGHLEDWVGNWDSKEYIDVAHTCNDPVKFFYSDSENFGYDYIEKRLNLMGAAELNTFYGPAISSSGSASTLVRRIANFF